MPLFQPRTKVEILRDMVARVVHRSRLVGIVRNGITFHVLAAAATEDAEQYQQMVALRRTFSIDDATGSDLDKRAAEIVPGRMPRRGPLFASSSETFTRTGTAGVLPIPIGSIVASQDSQGLIKYRTTAAGQINDLATTSAPIPIVALEAGSRSNVAAGLVNKIVSGIPGVVSVTNPAKIENGRDRESDASFRARLKDYVQSLSRGTVTALTAAAKGVQLADGRRVVFAKVREPIVPNGFVDLLIDDGTGFAEQYSNEFFNSPETVIIAAVGGEREFSTDQKPIRDDGTFELKINGVVKTRGVDYFLNPANGEIDLSTTSYPTGLTALDTVVAKYRYYIGLIQETQRVIDGDPTTPLTHPGYRAAGGIVLVKTPTRVVQTVAGQVSVLEDFDLLVVTNEVASAIQDYINGLDIGDDVIVSEIIERAMAVDGMFDFKLTNLSGSTPAQNQLVLDSQVARIIAADITLV